MAAFLVLLFPILLMVFALLMSRVEDRLRVATATVTENEVEEFFEQAGPDEVDAFIRDGWGGVMDRFRARRRPRERRARRR